MTDNMVTIALQPVGGPLGDDNESVVLVPPDVLSGMDELPPTIFLSNDEIAVGAVYDRADGEDRMHSVRREDGTDGWVVLARYHYRPGSDLIGGIPEGLPVWLRSGS